MTDSRDPLKAVPPSWGLSRSSLQPSTGTNIPVLLDRTADLEACCWNAGQIQPQHRAPCVPSQPEHWGHIGAHPCLPPSHQPSRQQRSCQLLMQGNYYFSPYTSVVLHKINIFSHFQEDVTTFEKHTLDRALFEPNLAFHIWFMSHSPD